MHNFLQIATIAKIPKANSVTKAGSTKNVLRVWNAKPEWKSIFGAIVQLANFHIWLNELFWLEFCFEKFFFFLSALEISFLFETIAYCTFCQISQ